MALHQHSDRDNVPEVPPFPGIGILPLEMVLTAHPKLPQFLHLLDPVVTATTFGGLLTLPELQGNTVRLEALIHFALAFCNGTRKPTEQTVAFWFSEMGDGPCGLFEDPAEDVFTSLITTSRGCYRILEGTWESAAFYLQRIVNIVEQLPEDEPFHSIRESIFALLKLSDLVCERSNLPRYHFGADDCETTLPNDVKRQIGAYRQRLCFSWPQLNAAGIAFSDLSPFIFDPTIRNAIPGALLSHSPVIEYPLVRDESGLGLVLPTAISATIRLYVIRFLLNQNLKEPFIEAMKSEYAQCFRDFPPLGLGRHFPLMFRDTKNGILASGAMEIDAGRMLHAIFTLDTLKQFETGGIAAPNRDPIQLWPEIVRDIQSFREHAITERSVRDGLTVIVGCGVGRAEAYPSSGLEIPNWHVVHLSAADAAILSTLDNSGPRTVMRLLEAEKCLLSEGVRFSNVNGLLTLISWARQLKGHLVPHANVPDRSGDSAQLVVLIEPSMILSLRKEAIDRTDLHAVTGPDGKWIKIRKANDSFFEEDRNNALYVPWAGEPRHPIPMVYLGSKRQWWGSVEFPFTYTRWQLLSTWLPRIAPILEQELPDLPDGALELVVCFNGYSPDIPLNSVDNVDEIFRDIRIRPDVAQRRVVVETGVQFERGLRSPTNVAETAFVQAVVRGFIDLSVSNERDHAEAITRKIVRNDDARDTHAFEARHVRDYLRDALPESPVNVDSIDDATLRIGLGWKVRGREAGGLIEGKTECTSFLNNLVQMLEIEFCEQLRRFDRKSVVTRALSNYETAMTDRHRWRNTTPAMLALHVDDTKTLTTLAEHDSMINATCLASRLLVEAAICECPLTGGVELGEMDLSQQMARLLLMVTYGGWSDAMYYDAMTPRIRITALGDVHADLSFVESVVTPFGHAVQRNLVESAIEQYPNLFEAVTPYQQSGSQFDEQFFGAWISEHGYTVDELRRLCDEIEDLGIERSEAVFAISLRELVSHVLPAIPNCEMIIRALTLGPRPEWRIPPSGYEAKDRQPWRFRRRLSLLRLPIVRIDASDDPLLIVTPGLFRDALGHSCGGYYEGSFSSNQLKSHSMKEWFSVAANRRGSRFAEAVARRLEEGGWRCEREVDVKKILRKKMAMDYGDVDVFAVHPDSKRILLIECKDLHFHKTIGELAEQLSDYRGGLRGGKRDSLKKHSDRSDILRSNCGLVYKYAKMETDSRIESWIVFRNPVPMLFSSINSEVIDGVTTFAQLATI